MTSQQPDEPAPPDEQPRLEATASGSGTVFQAGRDQHLHFADGASAATRVRGEPVPDVCPYPGLAAFGPEQERWFFGRDRATAVLGQRLDAKLTGPGLAGTGPLILIGPSGAGKSSLLQAGLIPALDQGRLPVAGSRSWPRALLTPTAHPVLALARELSPLTGGDPGVLAGSWLADPDECLAVVRQARAADGPARVIIVVDQFEEVFTLCTDEPERRAFIDLLDRLAARPADARPADAGPAAEPAALVLIAVRADSYADCLRYRSLRAALQASPVLLDPMTAAELRQAILFPAQDVGLDVEPGLIEVLLRDAGVAGDEDGNAAGYPAGRLPLLAHALRATWQEHEGHRLTVHGYQVTGGISNAVATSADREFAALDEAGQQAARALFLRLVKTGEGTEDVCRRVSRADLIRDIPGGAGGAALDAFTRARLLTQDQDTVSITHEVLLRAWPRLRTWLDEDRAGNLIRQDLESAATSWDRDQRAAEALYRGGRLDTARTWARGHDTDLTGTARDFLAASTRQRHRASRLRRSAAAALAVLTVVAVVTSVIALRLRSTAVQQRDQAIYNQTVTEALQQSGTNPALAAQLDIATYQMRSEPAALGRLITTENAPLPTLVARGAGAVTALADSPARHLVVSGENTGTIRLWDVADPRHPRLLSRLIMPAIHGAIFPVWKLAISPDGRLLAAAGLFTNPILWDVANTAHPRRITLPGGLGNFNLFMSVAFSPDGHVLASGDASGRVQLWDVADATQPRAMGSVVIPGHPLAEALSFSPAGTTLATGDGDGDIRLWAVTTRDRLRALGSPGRASTAAITSLTFSPAGGTLASSGNDGAVRLWHVARAGSASPVGQPLIGTGTLGSAVAFSPDGSLLATCYAESIRLWDVADPAHVRQFGAPLTTSTDGVDSVLFGPAGRTLVSGGANGTLGLWNMPPTTLTGPADAVDSLAFSSAGHILASSDGSGNVQFWDVVKPTAPDPIGRAQAASATALAFSQAGTVAIGTTEPKILLWAGADPAHLQVLHVPNGSNAFATRVRVVAFSPDGRLLASALSDDTVIRLWNVASPTQPRLAGQIRTGFDLEVLSVAFSPDGRVLAAGGSGPNVGAVELWDVASPGHPRALGRTLPAGSGVVNSVALSPHGHLLATADEDGTIRLWDVADPAHPRALGRPFTADDSADTLAFSPDGRTLAAGIADGTILLWHLGGASPLQAAPQTITASTDSVNMLAYSPNGRVLASGSNDGGIRLWTLSARYATQQICATTQAELTRQRWDQDVSPLLPYRPPC